jgi:hypothetical protein
MYGGIEDVGRLGWGGIHFQFEWGLMVLFGDLGVS